MVTLKRKIETRKVGDRIKWCLAGTHDEIMEGEVAVILEWPLIGGVRAYGVKPDKRTIVYSIVKIDSVIEETENA